MIRPSSEALLRVFHAKGYRVYDTPGVEWNLNIAGIRATPPSPGQFADTVVVFHRVMGVWDVSYFPATTLPSDYFLRRPLEPGGTPVLKAGQYPGAFKIARHSGGRAGHTALCQTGGDVAIYRETAADGTIHFRNLKIGIFGIDIHRGPRNGVMQPDNEIYAHGCQIFADQRHFSEFMAKCKFGRTAFLNRFTYTLLNEADFQTTVHRTGART